MPALPRKKKRQNKDGEIARLKAQNDPFFEAANLMIALGTSSSMSLVLCMFYAIFLP